MNFLKAIPAIIALLEALDPIFCKLVKLIKKDEDKFIYGNLESAVKFALSKLAILVDKVIATPEKYDDEMVALSLEYVERLGELMIEAVKELRTKLPS